MPDLRFFVVVHTALRDEAPSVRAFEEAAAAMEAFEAAEAQVAEGYKVALLSAASLDDLRITHANLFGLDAMRKASA